MACSAVPWHPRDFASIRRLFAMPRFDVVYLMGENRLSYLARAIGARWIVGFAGELPHYKNWLVDDAVPYADQPEAWTDTAARLVDGPPPPPFDVADWPLGVQHKLPAHYRPDYVVLHVGASSPTRYWPAAYWQSGSSRLASSWHGSVLWSGGPGEGRSDRAGTAAAARYRDGRQRLACRSCGRCWPRARACVCPDTGIAHLAKIAGVPLVMLFGPGSEVLVWCQPLLCAATPAWVPARRYFPAVFSVACITVR